jgi:glutaredoxin
MSIWKSPWTYVIIILLLIGIFYGYRGITGRVTEPGQYDEFAQYLTQQGATMYGTEWCSHCKNQKKLFGSSFQYIDYVDCDYNKQECTDAGVRGYPTWKINNQNYPGEQPLERLASLTGYPGEI